MSLAAYDANTREVAWALLKEYEAMERMRVGSGRMVLSPFYEYHAKRTLNIDPWTPLHYARSLSPAETAAISWLTASALRVIEQEFGIAIPDVDSTQLGNVSFDDYVAGRPHAVPPGAERDYGHPLDGVEP